MKENDKWKENVKSLVQSARNVFVSSIDKDGYPHTKAMLSLHRCGLGLHYFSTNSFAEQVSEFLANPKACIYYCNEDNFQGFMLTGKIEVCTDSYHKELLWRDGFECHYPKGVTDDTYCVYKFIAEKGSYFPEAIGTFDISELLDDTYVEITRILQKFSESGWDLIAEPSKAWLEGIENSEELISAIATADKECGSCGCEYDVLYKQALDLKEFF